jgi:hypothetical protein
MQASKADKHAATRIQLKCSGCKLKQDTSDKQDEGTLNPNTELRYWRAFDVPLTDQLQQQSRFKERTVAGVESTADHARLSNGSCLTQ